MSPDTVQMLLLLLTTVSAGCASICIYLLRRGRDALKKGANVDVSDSTLAVLEKFAIYGINYAEERCRQYLKSLEATGPTTPAEKKELAIQTMRELAELEKAQGRPAPTFTDAQASIVVDALVQAKRPSLSGNELVVGMSSERPTAAYHLPGTSQYPSGGGQP